MADNTDVNSDCENPAKRLKLDLSNSSSIVTCGPSLLHLSDDVLLLILCRLKACDLISLSKTCRRLANVSFDHTLWSRVDCRDSRFNDESLNTTLDIIGASTQYLALDFISVTTNLKGEYETPIFKIIETITEKCMNLHTLILESVIIKAKQLKIDSFPPTLRHLSLKGSVVNLNQQKTSYLFNIGGTMPNLEVLILSDCHWLEAHSLLAIAKCTQLRELRLDGCQQLGNCLAYCSMVARFSFKNLETLDLRGTQMGDSEVACFNRVSSLRHLYLASPASPRHGWQLRTGAEHIAHACMIVCQRNADNRYVSQRMRLRPDLHRDELERMIQTASNLPMGVIQNLEEAEPREERVANPAPPPSDNPGGSGTSSGSKPVSVDGGECSNWSAEPTPDVGNEKPSCSRQVDKVEDDDDDDDDDDEDGRRGGEEKEKEYIVVMLRGNQGGENLGARERGDEDDEEPRGNDARERRFRQRRDQLCGYFVPPIPRRGTDLVTDNAMYDLFDTPQRDRQMYVRLGCEPPASSRLHTLVLRNYRGVTDNTLLVVAEVETIRYLDVTGTSVTRQAVETFARHRPDVEIISDFSGDKVESDGGK